MTLFALWVAIATLVQSDFDNAAMCTLAQSSGTVCKIGNLSQTQCSAVAEIFSAANKYPGAQFVCR